MTDDENMYKIGFEISSPDDERQLSGTDIYCKEFKNVAIYTTGHRYNYTQNRRVIVISPRRQNKKDGQDMYIQQITVALRRKINIRELIKNSKRNSIYMRVGKANYLVAFRKDGIRYACNGMVANFDILIGALAKVIYRSCFIDDEEALDDYFVKCVELPENIQYVIENRAPYYFFEEGVKQEVRINVRQIGKDRFALEVSNGVWGEMNLRDLNTFVNSFLKGHRKGKWHRISPKRLWEVLLEKEITPAQEKVMLEFLKQNRTQDIVDQRAMELFESLDKRFKKIKRVKWKKTDKTRGSQIVDGLVIRGFYADWLLLDTAMKHEFQEVTTYVLVKESNMGRGMPNPYPCNKELIWSGPICIDNMQGGASKGDQFATRALACMNDKTLIQRVSTVKNYLGDLKDNQTKIRLDWDALSAM